jgi:hypothetical protein
MGFLFSTWGDLEDDRPRYLGVVVAVFATCRGTLAFYAARKVTSLDGMNLGYYGYIFAMVGAFCAMSHNKEEFFPSDPWTGRLLLIKMAIGGVAANLKFIAVKIIPFQKFNVIK